jgi:cystathionine beta-lyase
LYLAKNTSLVRNFLVAQLPKVKLIEPEGTYLLWLDFREYNLSNDELKKLLVEKAGIGFNAGGMFGDEGSGFQRMNIACPAQTVSLALQRLKSTFGNM